MTTLSEKIIELTNEQIISAVPSTLSLPGFPGED